MMTKARTHPFSATFDAWFATAFDLHDIMSLQPSSDHDAVEIVFSMGDGALRGYGHPNGISIAAMRDQQVWDYLYDLDVVPENSPEGWFCSLCLEGRESFPSIEALWMSHSFEALRGWVNQQLRPAAILEYCGDDGVRWARLTDVVQQAADEFSVISL